MMNEKVCVSSETADRGVSKVSSHDLEPVHGKSDNHHQIRDQDLDEAAKLLHDFHDEVTPEQNAHVRRKIDRRLMPLMCTVYFIQYLDKTTLGASSILGLFEDNHLSQSEYNWLGTIFYLAYLIFEWPQNLAMQRYPPGKWMAGNILVWYWNSYQPSGIALCAHAGCSSFAGLFVCRLILGACEGSITTGFMIVTGMFYTHAEVTPRIAYWSLFNGFAGIFSGLLSYAVYHMSPDVFSPWKLLMLITGLLTVVVSICFWILVPDNLAKAHFLTHEERVIAVARLRNQSTGTENKIWKKDQFIEAMKDWKSWAFLVYGAVANVSNSSGNMTALIVESFGFTTSQTTLLGCGNGAVEAVAIIASALLAKSFPNARAYLGAAFAIPNIISGILLVALPWSARGALLFAMYLGFLGGPDFIYAISWCISSTTGHTKKTTTNAMLFIGYCLGNLVSPQMWRSCYAPRYYLPWGIILATYVLRPVQLLVMRYLLQKENRRRDGLGEKEIFHDEEGNEIDQTFSDITDRRNMVFRYPL